MEELHLSEVRQLKRIFRDRGFDQVPDRLSVVDAFFSTEEHLTPAELTARLIKQGLAMDEDFVARTMDLLHLFGFAHKKEFAGGVRYEHRHLDEHHDHLICTDCGRIEEFEHPELEALQAAIAERKGFQLLEHRHQLYGLCDQCRRNRRASMPLAMARPGEKVRVSGYLGGRKSESRLTEMGLSPGAELEVLTANGGPVMVACKGTRLAVGRKMARKLTCRPVDLEEDLTGDLEESHE
jgi:Fur family transcriptional regulator, ferric uptake regulator